MTEEYQGLTPPPELLQQRAAEYWDNPGESIGEGEKYIAIQAARWASEVRLKECVEWVANHISIPESTELRAAMTPKPPSLADEALVELQALNDYASGLGCSDSAIRRALERLQELENNG